MPGVKVVLIQFIPPGKKWAKPEHAPSLFHVTSLLLYFQKIIPGVGLKLQIFFVYCALNFTGHNIKPKLIFKITGLTCENILSYYNIIIINNSIIIFRMHVHFETIGTFLLNQ